ncbi:uncharacterized protein [Mytilus edulis]|uniref:uncharacterized protein n=1 Tax=Mytilus edulis TaxID=6550 RepID=UPI0039F08443
MGIDRDEFVVPNIRKYGFSLKRVLDELIDSLTAGFLIKPNIHITTRKPYNESSSLFIRKYLNGTIPVYDRLKYVHVPSRTHIASPILHNFNPEDGFKRYEASPTDVTLHHYRSCQKYFGKLFKSDSTDVEERKLNIYDIAVSTCQKNPQFKQKNIEIIANILKPGY